MRKVNEVWQKLTFSQRISVLFLLFIVIVTALTGLLTLKNFAYRSRASEPITPITPPTVTPPSTQVSRVFITSTSYNGNLGGLAGADAKCQERADAVNLGGVWKAWLSNDSISADSRLIHSVLPYVRIDGQVVANNWNSLISGQLLNPINRTELNKVLNSNWVWTNTTAIGEIRQTTHNSCLNWLSTGDGGGTGDSTRTDSGWTDYGASSCYYNRPIYCIEQVTSPTATPTPVISPTLTPTSTPPMAILGNGSFEIDNDNNRLPDLWTGKNLDSKDVLNSTVFYDGLKSFKFSPSLNGKKELLFQTLNYSGSSDQEVRLDLYNQSDTNASMGKAGVVLTVIYQDGRQETTSGVFPYVAHSWMKKSMIIVTDGAYSQIKVRFFNANNTTNYRIDNAVLTVNSNAKNRGVVESKNELTSQELKTLN